MALRDIIRVLKLLNKIRIVFIRMGRSNAKAETAQHKILPKWEYATILPNGREIRE
jgi:hypothetical protein